MELRDVASRSSASIPLRIDYPDHEQVIELIDVVTFCVEGVSVAFTDWDDEAARGPGLYVVVVAGDTLSDYADPMGANRWPVEDCRVVTDDLDAFFEAASDVAMTRDGAVVVSVDGTVLEQMVRFRDLTPEELADLDGVDQIVYADWMGARHMSAADTSARPDVVAAVTLSEEDGRVSIFRDGRFDEYEREQLGGAWCATGIDSE